MVESISKNWDLGEKGSMLADIKKLIGLSTLKAEGYGPFYF